MDLTREQLLERDGQASVQPLELPEKNGTVYLRPLSAAEADEYARMVDRGTGVRAALAVRVLCNTKGERLFKNGEAQALGQSLPSKSMERIVRRAVAMNGLDDKAAEAVEAELDGEGENPTE